MNFQAQHPDWSDGPSNKAMIDSLDALGGAGLDLGDVEAFQMLDDIERFTNEKLRAADLLRGDGQANSGHSAEPTLSRSINSTKRALLAEHIQDFKDLPDAPSFLKAGPVVSISSALASKPSAPSTQERVRPAQNIAPNTAQIGAAVPNSLQESKVIGTSTQELELPNRKKPLPEDFLPPDFFDPRDRQPRKKWGRWVFLGIVFVAMLSFAGYLVVKAYKDSRPSNANSMGDLTKPIRR
jgi:hypothetical protein